MSLQDLIRLAFYLQAQSKVSMLELKSILDRSDSVFAIINHFEKVSRSLLEAKTTRDYSEDEPSQKRLQYALGQIKLKGKTSITPEEQKRLLAIFNEANAYGHSSLESADFHTLINGLYDLIWQYKKEKSDSKLARILAYEREIFFRKQGKWVNHTQMITLIYAAAYDDGSSMLMQMRTGEGKSIFAALRVAHKALMGEIVNVFSSKESLSVRDYAEFSPFMTALRIPHYHITATSDEASYVGEKKEGSSHSRHSCEGAVHYATPAAWALYHMSHTWRRSRSINWDDYKTVHSCFVDEADYNLQFDHSQYNFSVNAQRNSPYNLDEWICQETYEFYLELSKAGQALPEKIQRVPHLKALCERILAKLALHPKGSPFVTKYIEPVVSGDAQDLKQCDEALLNMLRAAHHAHHLQENKHFSIHSVEKIISRQVMKARFARVLIDNQDSDSTYSDWVQQFLHVRLNRQARALLEPANFFVEPVSQIALSLNAAYIFRKFKSIEGCSGTYGDLDFYHQYGIARVLKIPTHTPIRSQYRPAIYAPDEKAHIEALADAIWRGRRDHNILVHCEDDIQVKHLYRAVLQKLQEKEVKEEEWHVDMLYADTNDTGKKEQEILAIVGEKGRVTFSSRLDRGSDIQSRAPAGTLVFRAHPAIPIKMKQQNGRQGRNGLPGVAQDIINYAEVEKLYRQYQRQYAERCQSVWEAEEAHLATKMKKHDARGSKKFTHLMDRLQHNQYLTTRVVMRMKFSLHIEAHAELQRKNKIIASLSSQIMEVLNHVERNTYFNEAWLALRERIDMEWNAKQARHQGMGSQKQDFFEYIEEEWYTFVGQFSHLGLVYKLVGENMFAKENYRDRYTSSLGAMPAVTPTPPPVCVENAAPGLIIGPTYTRSSNTEPVIIQETISDSLSSHSSSRPSSTTSRPTSTAAIMRVLHVDHSREEAPPREMKSADAESTQLSASHIQPVFLAKDRSGVPAKSESAVASVESPELLPAFRAHG